MPKPIYGYWNYRGFGHHIRVLLKYLDVDYEDKYYYVGSAPDFSRDEWFSVKFNLGLDFASIPYWTDDDVKLTESKAIFNYIARKYGPELIPTDVVTLAQADMVESVALDLRSGLVNVTHGITDEVLADTLKQKLTELDGHFGSRQYVIGDKITYVDFFVYEVLHQLKSFPAEQLLQPYPNLLRYMERFESIPKIANFIQENKGRICYRPSAKYVFPQSSVQSQ